MEVDCDSELNEKDSQDKMSESEHNVEIVKERKDIEVFKSDTDEIVHNDVNVDERKNDVMNTDTVHTKQNPVNTAENKSNGMMASEMDENVPDSENVAKRKSDSKEMINNLDNKNMMEVEIESIKIKDADNEKGGAIQASDMDKILHEHNKYINECEEVLLDCAKYLKECGDTESLFSDDEESDIHSDDINSHVDDKSDFTSDSLDLQKHSKLDGEFNPKVVVVTDDLPDLSDSKNELSVQNGANLELKSKESETDGRKDVLGNPNGELEKNVCEIENTGEASKIGNDPDKNTKNTSLTMKESVKDIQDVKKEDDNVFIGNHEQPEEINENPQEDKIKVNLNHSETDSDDAFEDSQDTVKLVPLRISEEFDAEMEKIENDMKELVKDEISSNAVSNDKEFKKENDNDLVPNVQESVDTCHNVLNEVKNDANVETRNTQKSICYDTSEVPEGAKNIGDSSQTENTKLDVNKLSDKQSEDILKGKGNGQVEPDEEHNSEADKENIKMATALKCSISGWDAFLISCEKVVSDFERMLCENWCGKARKAWMEMKALQDELTNTKRALTSAQSHLANQQSKSNNVIMSLKIELYKTQTALKQERTKSHKQLSDVISHLTLLEGNLRKGQLKHKKDLKAKNMMIQSHEKEILKLREQNEQLLNAIKEICANGGMNGYMREKQSSHSEKKGHNGKLGMVKDKLLMKNRSSLELNSFNLEKFNVKNQRLCSSQEDLKNLHDDAFEQNSPGTDKGSLFDKSRGTSTRGSKHGNKNHRKNLQNYFTEPELPRPEMNKSNSDSSQSSENSSGVFSMSDQDLSRPNSAGVNGHHDLEYVDDDDDDDGRYFSFSSTHINTVIDEEEALGPVVSHTGQMMSMGSMPMLAHVPDDQRLYPSKDRPHSLSSVDLISIQRQAETFSKGKRNQTISESSSATTTPPPSPSYNNNNNKPESTKSEMTPFQTFKTMFKRKGSKNKGNKKRSVSLSQTTNMEYSEALKKHFQKYDMQ